MLKKLKIPSLRGSLRNDRRNLFHSTVSILFSQVFVFACQLVTGVIIARALMPEGRGQYAVLLLIPNTMQSLGSLGLNLATCYFCARDTRTAPKINANNMLVSFLAAATYTVLLFFLYRTDLAAPYRGFISEMDIYAMGTAILFLMFNNYSQSLFLGKNLISARNVLRIFSPLATLTIFIYLLLSNQLTVKTAFLAWILTNGLGFIITIYFLIKLNVFAFIPDFVLLGRSLKMGSKSILGEVAGYIILQSDVLLVRYYVDDKATGIYSLAASLSFLLFSIPQSIGQALFPHISKMEAVDKIDATDMIMRQFRLTLIIMLSLSALAWNLAPLMIGLIYGKNFSDSAAPFFILSIAVTMGGSAHILETQLSARNRLLTISFCAGTAAVMNVLLNLYLIPQYSYMGAAMSSLASYTYYGFMICMIYIFVMKRSVIQLFPRIDDFRVIFGFLFRSLRYRLS
jgi:O-antigen/teichoic acid export membrane protein